MVFPTFEEFLSTLSAERLEEILGDFQAINIFQINGLSAENIDAFVSDAAHKLLGYSVSLNLRILKEYHEWLSNQMSEY